MDEEHTFIDPPALRSTDSLPVRTATADLLDLDKVACDSKHNLAVLAKICLESHSGTHSGCKNLYVKSDIKLKSHRIRVLFSHLVNKVFPLVNTCEVYI